MECSRTRCNKSVDKAHYVIYNNGTVEGRKYCCKCGFNITKYAKEQFDAGFTSVKLEYDISDGEISESFNKQELN